MPDQGLLSAAIVYEELAREVDSIRARERSFTVFPQISDVRKTGRLQKDRFPAKQTILAKLRQRTQQNFGGPQGVLPLALVFPQATHRMSHSQDEVCRR
jgi:hypothetical protein